MTPFRIAAIHLDDDENLLSIIAVVPAAGVVDRIRRLLDDGQPVDVVGGNARIGRPAELRIELSAPQVRRLLAVAGDITAKDPRHVPGLYDSLARIAGMIEGE